MGGVGTFSRMGSLDSSLPGSLTKFDSLLIADSSLSSPMEYFGLVDELLLPFVNEASLSNIEELESDWGRFDGAGDTLQLS